MTRKRRRVWRQTRTRPQPETPKPRRTSCVSESQPNMPPPPKKIQSNTSADSKVTLVRDTTQQNKRIPGRARNTTGTRRAGAAEYETIRPRERNSRARECSNSFHIFFSYTQVSKLFTDDTFTPPGNLPIKHSRSKRGGTPKPFAIPF